MTRRIFLLLLPINISPHTWGVWQREAPMEQLAVSATGAVTFRLRVRHSVSGATKDNTVRIQPLEGHSVQPEEMERARDLAHAMLNEWLGTLNRT